jgi:hypothetical protein
MLSLSLSKKSDVRSQTFVNADLMDTTSLPPSCFAIHACIGENKKGHHMLKLKDCKPVSQYTRVLEKTTDSTQAREKQETMSTSMSGFEMQGMVWSSFTGGGCIPPPPPVKGKDKAGKPTGKRATLKPQGEGVVSKAKGKCATNASARCCVLLWRGLRLKMLPQLMRVRCSTKVP